MEILNDQMPPANIISSREPYSEGSVSCHILEVHYLKILLLYCICETRTKIVMCALSCVLVSKTRSFLLWIPNTLENIIFFKTIIPNSWDFYVHFSILFLVLFLITKLIEHLSQNKRYKTSKDKQISIRLTTNLWVSQWCYGHIAWGIFIIKIVCGYG